VLNLKSRALLVAGEVVNRTRGKLGPWSCRICLMIARARKMNSCMIEFTDNGQLECVSRNSLRKVKP
jgi:hypothetical protein